MLTEISTYSFFKKVGIELSRRSKQQFRIIYSAVDNESNDSSTFHSSVDIRINE